MAVLAKRNGNSDSRAQRARAVPTPFDFFPDLLGVNRMLDAMSSSSAFPEAIVPAFPAVDISEQDGKYVIEAAVPGFRTEDIAIEVTSNQVTISGQHDEEDDDSKRRYSEIRRAAFTRTLALPRDVNPESAKATFENGVLKIRLEPTNPIGAKKVPIEAK
jgi:HSP20 family molecular chaperone IbpA